MNRWLKKITKGRLGRGKGRFTRRGMIVTIMVLMLGTTANVIAMNFFRVSMEQYKAAVVTADGFRARQLAVAGFQSGLTALKYVPEEFLYQQAAIKRPPAIRISPKEEAPPGDKRNYCAPACSFRYSLDPEDGRFNVNNLVQPTTDEVNKQWRPIFQRFFRNYDFPEPDNMVDAIIDWIDENNNTEPGGAENEYYSTLRPPIKIKDYRLFSLSEIAQIKGISYKMIFSSQAPEDWKEQQEELKFQTEAEKNLIQDHDWIPATNLTAFIPLEGNFEDKININAARYHVMLALSPNMSKQSVQALFKFRDEEKGGYIKNLSDLKLLPEFQVKNGELSLYDELVGSGTSLSGLIKTKGEIYRITGVGIIDPVPGSDNKPVTRKITGLYDNVNKKLIYYSED